MVGDPNIRPMTQTLEEMEAEYEHGTVFLKFVEEGKIIGSVRAYREGDTCHIGRLVVDPHHWRKGIGTKLIQAIENEFQGVSRFELYTRRCNQGAGLSIASRIHAFQNGQGERFVHFRIPREEELR